MKDFFKIRPYHPCDLSILYRICLLTGDSGRDASRQYKDPDLLGQFYVASYVVLEPDLCFVLTRSGMPCGYILGTRDSVQFYQRCEREWFPLLRERYTLSGSNQDSPDARIVRLIHEGHKSNDDLVSYPAHLHIDILPEGQGQGMGRKLVDTFISRLRELNVTAVHLKVGKANTDAIHFYERVGFHVIEEYEKDIAFGMRLL